MIKRTLILVIRGYQILLSPLVGQCCRFQPTCSAYGIEAITRHGALRGSWLTAKRILRCHPFGGHGYDPVPPGPVPPGPVPQGPASAGPLPPESPDGTTRN